MVMLDLDGVVYVDGHAVGGAPEALATAREAGLRLAFITNNASRTPSQVADHLLALGIAAAADDVVTSAQAAARVLARSLGPGARVVCLGATGLREALTAESLVPVEVDQDAEAIVTGYGPEVLWRDVMRAAVRIREGLWWVASNTDHTIPTRYGPAPGHGVLVETLRGFSRVDPVVAGKPERPLLEETVRRVGGERPLMVGDRLDTDIAGARGLGVPSLLVLTGVTGLDELLAARPEERPDFLGADLGALLEVHRAPEMHGGVAELGGWRAAVDGGELRVSGGGEPSAWWRAAVAAGWHHLDETGDVAEAAGLSVPEWADR